MQPESPPKTPSLGAAVSVSMESAAVVTRSTKCRCGWSAAASGTDVARTEAHLMELLEAHRRECRLGMQHA